MASPKFLINGSDPALGSVPVTAGAPFVATLVSTDGVSSTAWTMLRADELTDPAAYTLVSSGVVQQTCTTTALAAGTAGALRAVVDNGVDPATGDPSQAMTFVGKFHVLTGNGLEVGVAAEYMDGCVESSPTHGMIKWVDSIIRALYPLRLGLPGAVATTGEILGGVTSRWHGLFTGAATDRIIALVGDVIDIGNTTNCDAVNLWSNALITGQVGGGVQFQVNTNTFRVENRADFGGAWTTTHTDTAAHPYTVVASDLVIIVDTTGDTEIDLPAVATATGRHLWVKDGTGNAVAKPIDIKASGAELIDGTNVHTMGTAWAGRHLYCDGAKWHVLSHA